MVARYAGACLGLLAFTIVIIAGLFTQNPVTVTLSRSVLALFIFCVIGLVLGTAAQKVVAEHERKRESEIRERYRDDAGESPKSEPGSGSTEEVGTSIQA